MHCKNILSYNIFIHGIIIIINKNRMNHKYNFDIFKIQLFYYMGFK